jgi:hypothetical protein
MMDNAKFLILVSLAGHPTPVVEFAKENLREKSALQ